MTYDRDKRELEKREEVTRDHGKWVKGTPSPNPKGRPKREVELAALQTLYDVLTPEEWGKAVQAILKRAQLGDVAAFNTLRDMYAGKPTEHLDVTSTEVQLKTYEIREVSPDVWPDAPSDMNIIDIDANDDRDDNL